MDITAETIMNFFGANSGYLYALFAIIAALVAARIATGIINGIKRGLASRTKNSLDDIILDALKRPVKIGILLAGVMIALRSLPILSGYSSEISMFFTVIFAFYAAYFVSRIAGMVIEWYSREVAAKTKTEADDKFLPVLKKAVYGIIMGIVFMAMLGQLGIRVETLIATLGIGGLALALALQPTLTNFFSGMQMVLDRPLRIGDYIELSSGHKGTVVDIGWRSTRIRTYMNNIVTIPNSKISDSTIVNYDTPDKEIGFAVECGVAYDSDLDKVERVSLDVARQVLRQCNGPAEYEPAFRFREFADSSINFKVLLRTKTLSDSYIATHEFIKALKKRFDKEGIVIAFPQLDVHFDRAAAAAGQKRKLHRGAARRKGRKR